MTPSQQKAYNLVYGQAVAKRTQKTNMQEQAIEIDNQIEQLQDEVEELEAVLLFIESEGDSSESWCD